MTTYEMQQEICKRKKENGILILAHSYEGREITSVADFTGDSYALACRAKEAKEETVVMCGVRFMAETVKLLAPHKKVLLSHAEAGCPMAEQLTLSELAALQAAHPNAVTVAYVNTTAELKTKCDVCVTSSSAERILRAIPAREIIFIPDANLGRYVAERIPEKTFYLVNGCCPVHALARAEDVKIAREKHPEALLLVHPECLPEVSALADYAGSTSGIMAKAKESAAREFIIGTETTIVEHLRAECPGKRFYPLTPALVCKDMKLTTLNEVLACVSGGGEEITLPPEVAKKARRCIDEMIRLGG